MSLDLTSASRFNEMLDIGVDSVGIDDGLSFDDLAGPRPARSGSIDEDTIVNRTLPVEDYMTDGGAAVLRIVEPDADAVLNEFRGTSPSADFTPGLVQVKVVNASGAEGQAEAVGDALEHHRLPVHRHREPHRPAAGRDPGPLRPGRDRRRRPASPAT